MAAALLSISPAPTSASATRGDGSPVTAGQRVGESAFDVPSITVSSPAPVCELYLNTESEVTLRLLGVEIGNWINGAPMAGETFGWGPDGSAALVFVDRTGPLVFLGGDKRTRVVAGVKGRGRPHGPATARASRSPEDGRRKYRLLTAVVTRGRENREVAVAPGARPHAVIQR